MCGDGNKLNEITVNLEDVSIATCQRHVSRNVQVDVRASQHHLLTNPPA